MANLDVGCSHLAGQKITNMAAFSPGSSQWRPCSHSYNAPGRHKNGGPRNQSNCLTNNSLSVFSVMYLDPSLKTVSRNQWLDALKQENVSLMTWVGEMILLLCIVQALQCGNGTSVSSIVSTIVKEKGLPGLFAGMVSANHWKFCN